MSAMKIITTGSVEDQTMDVARFLAKVYLLKITRTASSKEEKKMVQEKSQQRVKTLEEKSKNKAEIIKEIFNECQHIFNETTDESVNVFLSLLSLIKDDGEEEKTKLIMEACELVASEIDHPKHRLKVLSNFYNHMESNSINRFKIFQVIMKFAEKASMAYVLYPQFKSLGEYLTIWGCDKKQQRELYSESIRIAWDQNESQMAFDLSIKKLATYDGCESDVFPEALSAAQKVVIQAIEAPLLYHLEPLLKLGLFKDDKASTLSKLVVVFARENLPEFKEFQTQNPNFMKEIGLDEEKALKKMKVLTLLTTASSSNEIAYQRLAKAIGVNLNEIEQWVIEAVGIGLLDARLDQLNNSVIISRCSQRTFSDSQWSDLHERLNNWKSTVENILGVIHTANVSNRGN